MSTPSDPSAIPAPKHFIPLRQEAFIRIKQAALLRGLLRPFNGKDELEAWCLQCQALRDEMMLLAQSHVLPRAWRYPFKLLAIELSLQTTGAGTKFLRWRRLDRSEMGVQLWEEVMASPSTPVSLLPDLLAIENQRIALNMQISMTHAMTRQAQACAERMARAEAICRQRIDSSAPPPSTTHSEEPS